MLCVGQLPGLVGCGQEPIFCQTSLDEFSKFRLCEQFVFGKDDECEGQGQWQVTRGCGPGRYLESDQIPIVLNP